MANKPKRIDLTPEELKTLLKRVKTVVSKEDYEKIKAMAETIEALSNLSGEKASTIKRLLKMLFGQTSEKKKNVLGGSDEDDTPDESCPFGKRAWKIANAEVSSVIPHFIGISAE